METRTNLNISWNCAWDCDAASVRYEPISVLNKRAFSLFLSFFPFPFLFPIPIKLNNHMWARKLLHDYKFLLVKYGMQRKIWVKRRMVERNMVEEERIGQNMGEEEWSDLHFHPSQDQAVLHKHPKDHFSSSWLSSSLCWCSTTPSPLTPPHLHHHLASSLRETWPEVGRRYQS